MILDRLANFATDVLSHPPEKVVIENSWTNYKQINWHDNIVLVGILGGNPQGTAEIYNPLTEVMEYATTYAGTATFTFYGDDSEDNAFNFIALCKHDRAITSAKENEIVYKLPKTITHIGKVMGSQNQQKYQVEVRVGWTHIKVEPILRIDTAQIEFINDK